MFQRLELHWNLKFFTAIYFLNVIKVKIINIIRDTFLKK